MAAPHLTGAASLYKANNSRSSAAAIKSAILSSVNTYSALTGKCNTGG